VNLDERIKEGERGKKVVGSRKKKGGGRKAPVSNHYSKSSKEKTRLVLIEN